MELKRFEKYRTERYESQVNWYDTRAGRHKKCHDSFQWMVIVLSISLPVVIMRVPPEWALIPVVVSTLLAVATSAARAFKFQENWLNYRTIAEALRKEQYYYDAGTNGYSEAESREKLFVERVESLISRENILWLKIHTRNGKKQER